MILNLVILLLILIVLCNSVTFNDRYKCPKYAVKMKYMRASRLPDRNITKQTGIDMIILKLDRDIPCGIYNVVNTYGKATLMVSNSNSRIGYMHMKNLGDLVNINLFDFWDLRRVDSDENLFVQTYNRGCCI